MTDADSPIAPKAFISYRWGDIPEAAEDLERLIALRLGADRVFRDKKDMRLGHDFRRILDDRLRDCGVLLAVIGPQWLPLLARHTEPDQDYVRREITTALARGIPVIPVYTGGRSPLGESDLPTDLAELIGRLHLSLQDWPRDGEALAEEVRRHLGLPAAGRHLWDTPALTGEYVERPDLFAATDAALDAGRNVLLYGLPGIGKTEAAARCAARRRVRHPDRYQSVFWAGADSEDRLAQTLRAVLARLGDLPGDEVSQAAVAAAFRRRFENEGCWLLVLDNVENRKTVQAFFSGWEAGHLILTSRNPAAFTRAERLPVVPMDPDEGALLLLHRAGRLFDDQTLADASGADRDAAHEISRRVGGVPLALDQAGGYIDCTPGSSPARYLTLYDAERARLLRQDPGAQEERANVWAAITLAFGSLAAAPDVGPAAADLLRLCAFFAPDPVPEGLLAGAGSVLGGELGAALSSAVERDALIRAAAGFSLLSLDGDSDRLQVYRLVRDILQETLSPEERAVWAGRAVAAVDRCLPDPSVDPAAFQWLWPHAVTALELRRDFSLQAEERPGEYSLEDFSADLRVQHALKNGDSWGQLFGVDDVRYADLAGRTLHQLEDEETGRRLRRVIASLHRVLPAPRERRRAFACLYFVAHYWWDWYLRADDICPPLLTMWERSNTLVEQTEEEVGFLQTLRIIETDYPPGREYRTRSGDRARWERLGDALLRLRALLGLEDPSGLALSPGARYVCAITDLYLAQVRRYAPASSDPAGAVIWDLYEQAAALLHQNGDTFHENWCHYEYAEALREAGRLPDAWDQCLQALAGIVGSRDDPQSDEDEGDSADEDGWPAGENVGGPEDDGSGFDSELTAVTYRVMADILRKQPDKSPRAWMYYAVAALAALAFALSEGDTYAVALYDEMRERLTDQLTDPSLPAPEREAAERFLAAFWAEDGEGAGALPLTPSHSQIALTRYGQAPSPTRRRIARLLAAMPSRIERLKADSAHFTLPERFGRVLAALSTIEA